MKNLLLLIGFVLSLEAHGQQTSKLNLQTQKASRVAKDYILSNALYPKSYVAVKWSVLGELSHQTDYKLFDKTGDTTIDAKIDTFITLESKFPGYPKPLIYYTISHAFKLKTPSGQMTLKVYSFYFDRELRIVQVDKSTPEEQIAANRRIIAEAEEKKRLISEISQLKSDKLKQ